MKTKKLIVSAGALVAAIGSVAALSLSLAKMAPASADRLCANVPVCPAPPSHGTTVAAVASTAASRVASTAAPTIAMQAPPTAPRLSVLSNDELKRAVSPVAGRYKGAVVVGLVSDDGQTLVAYGRDKNGHLANGDTVFETASLTKVFSALLLSQAVQSGELSLDQPVDKVVDWHVPHYGKQPITLLELAEHTSGLPDWPSNRGSTESAYSSESLRKYLSSASLEFKPGQEMLYSNAGFALLGDILAEKAGKPYEELVRERICNPLGMKDTRINLDASMRERLAVGHNSGGAVMRASSPTAGGGADGIRSTAHDLLKFVAAYAGIKSVPFKGALVDSYAVRNEVDDDNDIGLAWYTRHDDGIVWKGGCIAGYRTYLGFIPSRHIGVVVLAGCNAFPSPDLGRQILLNAAAKQDALKTQRKA